MNDVGGVVMNDMDIGVNFMNIAMWEDAIAQWRVAYPNPNKQPPQTDTQPIANLSPMHS